MPVLESGDIADGLYDLQANCVCVLATEKLKPAALPGGSVDRIASLAPLFHLEEPVNDPFGPTEDLCVLTIALVCVPVKL